MDERTARDEERQLEAEAELRDLEWERSGFGGPMESEETRRACSIMEGQETVEEEPTLQDAIGSAQQEFVRRGANYFPLPSRSQRLVNASMSARPMAAAWLSAGSRRKSGKANNTAGALRPWSRPSG
jgi:hypothetical protein